jgi:hypothetical protein
MMGLFNPGGASLSLDALGAQGVCGGCVVQRIANASGAPSRRTTALITQTYASERRGRTAPFLL